VTTNTKTMGSSGFISPDDPLWARLLDQAEFDIYQTPEYVKLSGAHEDAEPVAFYARRGDDFCLIPLLLRRVPDPKMSALGWRDAASPYGYGGVLLSRNCSQLVFEEMLRELQATAAASKIVTAFLRMNPLQTLPLDVLAHYGNLCSQGEVVVADLSETDENLWRSTRENHRRTIRKLRACEFTVSIDAWEHYDSFVRIYRETMARLGARPYYMFSHEHFDGLRRDLGDKLHLCTVLSPEGEPAAAALFTSVNGVGHYHLGGTTAGFLKCAPSKLYIDGMLRWSKKNGLRYLNLGGGVSGRKDSLFDFKAGFSPLRMKFTTFRSVLHPPTYEALMAQATDPNGEDDYFPAYRRKI
jgi:GNAT acetyltransferase-like protein